MTKTNKIKKVFRELERKAKKINLSENRIELLKLLRIEAESGCPFADKIRNTFPELLQ